MLTQERVRELFDYIDGELFWKVSIGGVVIGTCAGRLHPNGRVYIGIDRKNQLRSRVIFLYHKGYLPDVCDHINNKTIDDRIENLREASLAENSYNIGLKSNNTSGVKGVSWRKDMNKWRVRVQADGKSTHVGYFCSLVVAKEEANKARSKLHGKFCNHG